VSYRSAIAFGTIRIVTDAKEKQEFFEALMHKYGTPGRDRPRRVFPRIGQVTVYEMTIERMTGKELALPGCRNNGLLSIGPPPPTQEPRTPLRPW
jgi:nitroimidazol reductase NimA-like FMN-containing flavoprotein (pyridoxamine 5'-phosphate oxidase superfamily)